MTAARNNADLVDALRRRDIPRPENFLDAFAAVVTEALASGETVPLRFLGSFRARPYPATRGRNPRTGRPSGFAAHRRVIFRASAFLMDAVNHRNRRRRFGHG